MLKPFHALILAAGQGKRMKSSLTKVLHPILFRPMIHHVIDLVENLPRQSIGVVVGENGSAVREACRSYESLTYHLQESPKGTGDAVLAAESALAGEEGNVLVLNGDVVALQPSSLEALMECHQKEGVACTLMSAQLSNPFGYGRIIRNENQEFVAIREQSDCSEVEKKVSEVNAGVYCFRISSLFEALRKVATGNQQGEYYLTDVIEILVKKGERVISKRVADPTEIVGINERKTLIEVEQLMRRRVNHCLLENGVSLRAPNTTTIDPHCQFQSDIEVEGDCRFVNSQIDNSVTIESNCRIVNSFIGAGTHLKEGCYIENSYVGPNCVIGPYAHLRPGTRLESEVKIGNFVELKKSTLAVGVKASHLSYIGDAKIGKNTNIGCGFITCNYDGFQKHETIIGEEAFIGSDSQAVAPVKIGDGSYVASGTTITRDVPAEALAISRGRQVNKKDFKTKLQRLKHKE